MVFMGILASANLVKRDIAEILGKSPRTIQLWTDQGLVVPDIRPSQGKGIARVYSARNLLEFAMIDFMVMPLSIPIRTIKYIFDTLREGHCPYQRAVAGKDYDPRTMGFEDFFESSEWGHTKELIFGVEILLDGADILEAEPIFTVVMRDEGGSFLSKEVSGAIPLRTVRYWLGGIKNGAEARIKEAIEAKKPKK
jgi:DNA-binding transcriptional MerR regulator